LITQQDARSDLAGPWQGVAYRPRSLIGQALDLHTPDSPRIAHGRSPSVFALGVEVAQKKRNREKVQHPCYE